MEDIIGISELTEALTEALAEAADRSLGSIEVHLRVPYASHYVFTGDDGRAQAVYLPTGISVEPVPLGTLARSNGGPAAVFRVSGDGISPGSELVEEIAQELFVESVIWGSGTYSSVKPIVDHAPTLPIEFAPLVRRALDVPAQIDE